MKVENRETSMSSVEKIVTTIIVLAVMNFSIMFVLIIGGWINFFQAIDPIFSLIFAATLGASYAIVMFLTFIQSNRGYNDE